MNAAGQGKAWTGPQLAAQLATLDGVAPPALYYVVFRATRQPDGTEQHQYEVPDQALPLEPPAWPAWLAQHNLLGSGQLSVAVLVIREVPDAAGRLVECVLERRRGGADGPFYGNPARVEFVGPAGAVRLYRAGRDGQLQEIAPSPPVHAPGARGAEQFAGERQALERHFGPGIQVIDAREPTLFEDMAGLACIVHLRRTEEQELACGIGWHGTTCFILVADFPRFGIPLSLSLPDEAAVQDALHRQGLVRHETRLDERGLAVVARRRGAEGLFLLRVDSGRAHTEPYLPGVADIGTEDQNRWLRYAETYERLVLLDRHRDGGSDDIVVLTGDAGGHVWRHLIDADGVETWCRPADDAAVGALYRERLAPGTLARSEGGVPNGGPGEQSPQEPGTAPSPDSLLAKVRAFTGAMAALYTASDAALAEPPGRNFSPALFASLYALEAALVTLSAENAATQLTVLLADAEAGTLDPDRLARELTHLEAGLHDELALIRLVPLQPAQWRWLTDPSPFGAEVEARFPACAYDIEEAASCLAFRRPAAAVFHCMKILERGLLALGRLAGVADILGPHRAWSDILATLASADRASLAPLLSHVRRIRRRWRAPGLLPAEKYTETEAERVFQSVGAFMRELADRCDERGDAAAMGRAGKGRSPG